MTDTPLRTPLQVGFYASLALAVLTFMAFGLGMMAVPPAGPYCPGDCMNYPYLELLKYYPRDYLWMYVTVFQLCAFLIVMIANHFITPREKSIFSFISVAFTLMSATVLLGNYFLQFSVVPISVLKNQREGIALLTQYNGAGIFIALEEVGFFLMSIAFAFLAPAFPGTSRLEKSIRATLAVPVFLTFAAFIYYTVKFGLDRDYRFEVAAISINWTAAIVLGILFSIFYRRKLEN